MTDNSSETPKEIKTSETGHVVIRVPMVHSRRKLDIGKVQEEVGLGEPTDEKAFVDLKNLASDLTQNLQHDLKTPGINEDNFNNIAQVINKTFPFIDQTLGVASIPKQLEHYKEHKDDNKKILAEGIDCKLPTAIMGLVVQQLSQTWNSNVQVELRSQHGGSHPYLYIENLDNNKKYLIDFYTRGPKAKDSGIKFESFADEGNWERENSESVHKVRVLDEYGEIALKNYPKILPLNVNGLSELDRAFLA